MKSLIALVRTEFKLYTREPAALFFSLVFPLMLLVIFGSVFGNDPEDGFNGVGPMDTSVPGYGGLIIGTTAFMSIPVVISSYREHGIFRRMRATSVKPSAIILSQMIVNLVVTTVGLVLLFIGGKLLYGLRTPEQPLALIVVTLTGFLSLCAIGFLIGGVAKTSRTAQVIGNVVYFPQLFLSGATMPREFYPDGLRRWTEWMPMTQMVNLMKESWRGSDLNWLSLGYLVLIGSVSVVISTKVFRWD